MAGELTATGPGRPWQTAARYVLGAAVGILGVVLLLPKRSDLAAA